ncbi:hypothetical protein ABIE38_001687 [Dietzia sp. 2505]|uniref:hypothetical protein n=1 Tax=Dietzia sp. 2505 TaxID=3156457 RepID=UPI0033977424
MPAGVLLVALGTIWAALAVHAASQPASLGMEDVIGGFLLVFLAAAWLTRSAQVWLRRQEVAGGWWPLAVVPVVVLAGVVLAETSIPFDVRWSASHDDFSDAVTEIENGRHLESFADTRLGRYRVVFVDRSHDGHLRFITHTNWVTYAGFTHATSVPDESRGYFSYQPLADTSWYRMSGS